MQNKIGTNFSNKHWFAECSTFWCEIWVTSAQHLVFGAWYPCHTILALKDTVLSRETNWDAMECLGRQVPMVCLIWCPPPAMVASTLCETLRVHCLRKMQLLGFLLCCSLTAKPPPQ